MSENSEPRRSSIYQKKLGNEDGVDFLSNLPDSIICLIISKLRTKEVVETSLLSSRYKSLWKSITSLSFRYYEFTDKVRFARFVNRVLSFLESKSINEFYIMLEPTCDLYDVPTWFTTAIYRHVKVLTIIMHEPVELDNGISMPTCLYTSKTLEYLGIFGGVSLDVPEFVSLPKLTTLHLNYVNYSSNESIRRLISGCSSLEKLSIERDEFDGVTTFTIDSPTLKTLDYYFFLGYNESLEENFKFELKAPALRKFSFHDGRSKDFSVSNLSSLEFAKIVSSIVHTIDSQHEKVVQLMQGVRNVNHLWISGDALEALSHGPFQDGYFWNSLLRMVTNYSKQSLLQDLLDPSTKSHDFYLSTDSSDTTHVMRWSTPLELPICLLSCLKTISVSGFNGREREVSMIAYILKNARVLLKITISEASSEPEANFELREKILKFDQGSQRCEIIFS